MDIQKINKIVSRLSNLKDEVWKLEEDLVVAGGEVVEAGLEDDIHLRKNLQNAYVCLESAIDLAQYRVIQNTTIAYVGFVEFPPKGAPPEVDHDFTVFAVSSALERTFGSFGATFEFKGEANVVHGTSPDQTRFSLTTDSESEFREKSWFVKAFASKEKAIAWYEQKFGERCHPLREEDRSQHIYHGWW